MRTPSRPSSLAQPEPNLSSPAVDDLDPRRFELIKLGPNALSLEVMVFGELSANLRPLLILHSLEFPMPPSVAFCAAMQAAGLQVVFIRRSGFGYSSSLPEPLLHKAPIRKGATCITEAVIISQLISKLELKDVVLVSTGTATPVAYRLSAINASIGLSIFSNPAFNQEIRGDFRTAWLGHVLEQVLLSENGSIVTARAFKFQLQRNFEAHFGQILKRSDGDMHYLKNNLDDFEAAAEILKDANNRDLFYHLSSAMHRDALLVDGFFEAIKAVAIQGAQTTERIRNRLAVETDRLGIPLRIAPDGYRLAPYVSSDLLLEIIESHT